MTQRGNRLAGLLELAETGAMDLVEGAQVLEDMVPPLEGSVGTQRAALNRGFGDRGHALDVSLERVTAAEEVAARAGERQVACGASMLQELHVTVEEGEACVASVWE